MNAQRYQNVKPAKISRHKCFDWSLCTHQIHFKVEQNHMRDDVSTDGDARIRIWLRGITKSGSKILLRLFLYDEMNPKKRHEAFFALSLSLHQSASKPRRPVVFRLFVGTSLRQRDPDCWHWLLSPCVCSGLLHCWSALDDTIARLVQVHLG